SSPLQKSSTSTSSLRYGDEGVSGPHDDRFRQVHPPVFTHGGSRQQTQRFARARVDLEDQDTPPVGQLGSRAYRLPCSPARRPSSPRWPAPHGPPSSRRTTWLPWQRRGQLLRGPARGRET